MLGSGTGHYGHGSIMRGGGKLSSSRSTADVNITGNLQFAGESVMVKRAMGSSDPEEVKKAGNELYRRGSFAEALSLYDRAISLSPDNAAYRSNRAAALTALRKLTEAVQECEEAVRLDPGYGRAHQRLASLYLRYLCKIKVNFSIRKVVNLRKVLDLYDWIMIHIAFVSVSHWRGRVEWIYLFLLGHDCLPLENILFMMCLLFISVVCILFFDSW